MCSVGVCANDDMCIAAVDLKLVVECQYHKIMGSTVIRCPLLNRYLLEIQMELFLESRLYVTIIM